MPTPCFDENFTPTERKLLSKTFRQNCLDLGIADHDAVVEIRKVSIGGKSHLGCITRVEDDRFLILLNKDHFHMGRSIFAMGHEMVHFHQHRRGDLVIDDVKQGWRWRGTFFPAVICTSMLIYADLPWEKEAMSKDDKLYDSAIANLSEDERAIVGDINWRDEGTRIAPKNFMELIEALAA